ncbi:MAG TPA: hypothetical protein VNL98_03220 [Gemmatimonadales bacterium]|nr:hypothetical protein [Gemmatimonadales bacterium]
MSVATGRRTVRLTVVDAWRTVALEAAPGETVAALKARALAACGIPAERADEYESKLAGALVRDERQSLTALGVPDGGALVVLPRRRRAVR